MKTLVLVNLTKNLPFENVTVFYIECAYSQLAQIRLQRVWPGPNGVRQRPDPSPG